MKLNETVIRELVAIEREVIHASDSIDLRPLRQVATREQQRATLSEARRRREALNERERMDAEVWAAHRGIARAEAEAIEWREYAARTNGAPADADSDGTLRRPLPAEGETRRREAAGE
jgi:hypothetical protein